MATKKITVKKSAKDIRKELSTSKSETVLNIRKKLNEEFKSEIAPEVKQGPAVIIPSGILSMDLAVCNGGLLGGRILDIHGWEGTGKTLTCMTIGGYIQRCTKVDQNGDIVKRVVAFCDAEGTFAALFAQSAGVNIDELLLIHSTPDRILSGEDYFDIIVLLLQMGVDYIIVDSCPALVSSQVLVNETGQGQKASEAQLMSTGLKKITPLVSSTGKSLVHFINQKRFKPMAQKWERKELETGGNALKFYSSYRFEVLKTEDIEANVLGADNVFRKKKVGVRSCVRIVKNKTSPIPPYLSSDKNYHFEYDVYFEDFIDDKGLEYNRGVDVIKDYVDTAHRCGVISQSSSWYTYNDIKTNGKTEMIKTIRENPSIMTQIRDDVFSKMKVIIPPTV